MKTIGYNGVHYFQTHPHSYGMLWKIATLQQKSVEIYHDLPIKMVIFHSYVSLATG